MKDLRNRTLELNERIRQNRGSQNHGGPRTMNFEAYAAEGNRFIYAVADELETDRDTAARTTRAVLHAIRDRLPPIDAVQFGQGLPMAMKGIYFDRYDIARTPLKIRSGIKFIDLIYEKSGRLGHIDFPDNYAVLRALRGVFRVLENTMDKGQTSQIKLMLHSEIVRLIEGRPLRRMRKQPF